MSEPFDETMFDVIVNKMFERNIDQDVIDALREKRDSIFVDYRADDPNDITILNNKVERIAQLAATIESGDGRPDDELLNSMVRVLRTKY